MLVPSWRRNGRCRRPVATLIPVARVAGELRAAAAAGAADVPDEERVNPVAAVRLAVGGAVRCRPGDAGMGGAFPVPGLVPAGRPCLPGRRRPGRCGSSPRCGRQHRGTGRSAAAARTADASARCRTAPDSPGVCARPPTHCRHRGRGSRRAPGGRRRPPNPQGGVRMEVDTTCLAAGVRSTGRSSTAPRVTVPIVATTTAPPRCARLLLSGPLGLRQHFVSGLTR